MRNNSAYLAWQSPSSKDWHVVGLLEEFNSGYTFRYTKGATIAPHFTAFTGMNDLNKTYKSESLFPLFQNRLLSSKRPEYPKFLKWLKLSEGDVTPVNVLARSGALRGTDKLQMFKKIEVDQDGSFKHYFFVHGLSYLQPSASIRVSNLKPEEKLFLCMDCQNSHDENALLIRSEDPLEVVGYCPRYLAKELNNLLRNNNQSVKLYVEALTNDAPLNYRLMCRLEGKIDKDLFNSIMCDGEYEIMTSS